jgi:hypothetical protein
MNNNPYMSGFAGGLKMRIFLTEKLSFDSDLVIGKNYFHIGPGILGVPLILLSYDSSAPAGGLLGIIMMGISAEHIAYHLQLGGKADFSPFVSLLRFKYSNFEDVKADDENIFKHASFVSGIEINKYLNHFVLSPYCEYNISYDGYVRGFNFGFNLGYYFEK